jgi:hypothetical protein
MCTSCAPAALRGEDQGLDLCCNAWPSRSPAVVAPAPGLHRASPAIWTAAAVQIHEADAAGENRQERGGSMLTQSSVLSPGRHVS